MKAADVGERVERARDSGVPAESRHAAFDDLARAFEGMAFASALKILRDADEARDAVQDALLSAWSKLDQLRAPAAFGGWLRRLVATECSRRLRTRRPSSPADGLAASPTPIGERDSLWSLARVLPTLTEAERQAVLLFYVEGCSIHEIAAIAKAPPATIGTRLHAARRKVRRALPREVRASALGLGTRDGRSWSDALRDYVGVYRFEKRPELVVEIRRSPRGEFVASDSAGQTNVLYLIEQDTLVTQSFDGEGRFRRDARGHVSGFVYYEFGKRLGVAHKVDEERPKRKGGTAPSFSSRGRSATKIPPFFGEPTA